MLICELHEIFIGALLFRGCEHAMIKGAADVEDLPKSFVMEKIQASSLVAGVYLGLRSIKENGKCDLRMNQELSCYRN